MSLKVITGAVKCTQCIKALAIKPEALTLIPRTQVMEEREELP